MEKDAAVLNDWLRAGVDGEGIKGEILNHDGPDLCALLLAHLHCVRTAREEGCWTSPTVEPAALRRLAARLSPLRPYGKPLPAGLLRDLVQELLGGQPRPAARSTMVLVPLVDTEDGAASLASFTLELVPGGTGAFHPSLPLSLVTRDADFTTALSDAVEAATTLAGWPADADVRWSLERRAGR
jgi:hypothetical protein